MNSSNSQDSAYLKTLTVLYVEDDNDTRMQFSEFLARPVGTLITARDGAEGLEAFIKHQPDIVISDILMPKMDGLEMISEIRADNPSVPVIVITAFEQTNYLMRAIDLGVDKYVTKPVNSVLLFENLLDCAHRLRAEQQLKLLHQREIQEAWSKHNETVAIMAGGIAEDYNSLMQSILGYASLAKMSLDSDSEAAGYLDRVEKCSNDAEHLGKMLRILSNDFSGASRCAPLMPCIIDAVQNILAGSDIEVSFEYPDDLPPITFVDQQMQLVFAGLASNALEAMVSGGSLQVSAWATMTTEEDCLPIKPGRYIQVSFIDSGMGIQPDIMAKIFEPYFSTKKRTRHRGAQLNLALCRTVIMRHGGIITAQSMPVSGTEIRIWLPVVA